ncbi:uncharacterized protein LOC129803458 [Phlebotomus papatasi]|uniref:uncharacterized protein LOC129803458 n=1 Tax=Phlebotomus papatasi TaxID=29031 RepID=UPI002483B8B3|nr:uncharacterized protein LOC129803458 [Phlebotomus papatasi]
MEFLEDLVPDIKRNHSVLVYYFNWTLEKRDLCHIHWQYESMKDLVIHEKHRRKRSISGNGNILSSFQNTWFRRSITGYILVLSLKMLMNTMECIVEPLGVYLIIIDTPATESVLDIVREKLLIGWAIKRSYQIYVMLLNETFTLHPFAQDPMRNDSYGVLMNFNQRPPNILKDLNGYPLRIEMFHSAFNFERRDPQTGEVRFEGTDAEVMRSLKDFMNFSVIFQEPDEDYFGYRLPNGSFTGTIGRISTGRSDLALTGFFIKDYSNPDMDFTMPVYLDELCCVVRKAKQIPKYWIPLLCFDPLVWLCLFLSIFALSGIWNGIRWCESHIFPNRELLVKHYNLSKRVLNSKRSSLMTLQLIVDTTMLLISSPLRRMTRVTSERIFLSSVLLMGVVVVAIFQSNLSTAFTHPIYYRDITSLQALDNANLRITIKYIAMLDDLFPPEASEISQHLRHSIKLVNISSEPMIEMVMEYPNLATVTRKSTIQLENAKYFHTGEVFMVPECPKMYNLAYVLRRNSVLSKNVNFVLLHLTRGGFLEKWIQDMNYNMTWHNRKTLGYSEEEKFRIFNLLDLQLPFYVLLIGNTSSFIVLLVEIYQTKRSLKTN